MSQPFLALEAEQIASFLNSPSERTEKGLRDRALLAVLFSTGVRVSELVGINADDIKDKRITVYGKRRKYRLVLLSPFAQERLGRWLQVRYRRQINHEALFTTMRGTRRLGVRAVQLMVKRYATDVGLPRTVHTHTLRHSFAVDALQNGADIRQVQVMLGHSSPATTAIYLSMNDRMLEENHRQHHDSSRVYQLI